jgi:CHAT domain-containing protein
VPVHAAGIYEGPDQECCSHYFVSSYTPSLTALWRAQTHVQTIRRADLKLALLAAEHTQDASLPPLFNVKSEIQDIVGVAEQAHVSLDDQVPSNDATTAHVSKSLQAADIVHIACHGIQNMTDALSSGFYLSDGRLTISKLMELDLKHAFLAFLSACETAKGDQEQPDQTIHLAAAMLFAGFRSVFATMW